MKRVWDALKRYGSFKRLSSLQSSRIKEGISVKLPRNSAYIGILCAVRSGIWILTLARHEQPVIVAHHEQRVECRNRSGDRQLKLSPDSSPATSYPNRIALTAKLTSSILRGTPSVPLQSAGPHPLHVPKPLSLEYFGHGRFASNFCL
jgi:hypothetical protein